MYFLSLSIFSKFQTYFTFCIYLITVMFLKCQYLQFLSIKPLFTFVVLIFYHFISLFVWTSDINKLILYTIAYDGKILYIIYQKKNVHWIIRIL